MEHTFGSDSIPSGPINKDTVLTVKPLRRLVPIFPVQPDSNASVPPTGPFSPGAAPFFPFYSSNGSQNKGTGPQSRPPYPIPSPVPISSFKSPVTASRRSTRLNTLVDEDDYSQSDDFEDSYDRDEVEYGSNGNMKKPATRRKTRHSGSVSGSDVDIDPLVTQLLKSFNLLEVDIPRQADSDKDYVDRVITVYNLLRRKIGQLDDIKSANPGSNRRPDLRAGTILMFKGARANLKKRIGGVPGVEIGDIFFFRMEMCLVGVHAPSMSGIDYMTNRVSGEEEPLAVSIVSSGGYDDDGDDGDVLIYSGQGGQSRVKQETDQQLVRGNLALEKSLHKGNEVRVIRGLKDVANGTGKVYVYDGLYKIHESWIDKSKSGCNVFKYKLVRVPGQPEAFTLWKSIQLWKDGVTVGPGVILPDLTSGSESLPVCLVNDVDDEKGPAYFTYTRSLNYTKPFSSISSSSNCVCSTGCQPSNNCACVQRNGGYMPYTSLGVLLTHNSLIHECGRSCGCPPNCRNRISQAGLKLHLEVFKTTDKGWGLRSWDPIRAGAFICEYAGVVVQENVMDFDDNYVFDATRSFEPIEPVPSEERVKFPFPLIISAKNEGNVGRFMNHSCEPNVYWQPIVRENVNESYLHVGFYAIKHIPPMQELTYNYGMVRADRRGPRKKTCMCGSSRCNGYFY
ncbi:histone-lysine N-methyltransferase, H3 lysine-9 specific SUVH1-like [Rutidosis leptorrhynchoides]|uniref:histone-lysine N-methyltransferase, H3 lysine-9 specific SUVH1-like n=1 Tax=Rutidosis leptorrhynchoides TaxID=125765 RepID=UPI003A98DE34